ncbi:peptidylprolyl isomerase [Gloeobacter kilaueensis]|uniref:peptidylprolyl isomerase n=1 Tax=Gloeobacter kilaueensis TaxID=1416614 RepID=UPI000421134A|nr:peptidylprolyl isomerase [Gloeobacter kilaueensis]
MKSLKFSFSFVLLAVLCGGGTASRVAAKPPAEPVQIPAAYAGLPRLTGKALVELQTSKGPIVIAVDGDRSPINAGNFVDLVQKGVYTNTPVNRSEKGYLMQVSDPQGGNDGGYKDPSTGKIRRIPIEIIPEGQAQPVYGKTLKAAGIPETTFPVMRHLPGAVGLAHTEKDPNSGSTQFYITYGNNEMVNPRGNFLDGRYSVFGYVVDGLTNAEKLRVGDKILSAKVLLGGEKLQPPVTK